MSENLFGLTVAADKGLDDLQCQRLLSENRRYQEVMLQCPVQCLCPQRPQFADAGYGDRPQLSFAGRALAG